MIHVKRDQHGHIVAASQEGQREEGWEPLSSGDPELAAFAATLAGGQRELASSDLGLARVLEDLIQLLIEREVIRFTDLPPAAQGKLFVRRSLRSSLHSLKLLDEDAEKL